MPTFGDFERRMLSYFVPDTVIYLNGRKLIVVESAKPVCSDGEPKTDIYVLAKNLMGSFEEIKISYKKENADFLENKTNAERAEQLFGPDWRRIIATSTYQLKEQFENRIRIYKDGHNRTERGAITLGWKFELVNKPSGELSGVMQLTQQQIYDVYAGTNLSDDKKHAVINGRRVANSGIADYILVSDTANSAQAVIEQMYSIDEYIQMHPYVYFACKALNYRTYPCKYDGNRPLAVQVDWRVIDGKLHSDILFDAPLERNGKEMCDRLIRCMQLLRITTTDDIDSSNSDMTNVYE